MDENTFFVGGTMGDSSWQHGAWQVNNVGLHTKHVGEVILQD